MGTAIESSRALTFQVAQSGHETDPDPQGAAMTKLRAANVANSVVSGSLQIHGADSYTRGHPLEYLYRFVRGYRIAGGTDEILQNTIAGHLDKEGLPGVLRWSED